MKDGGEIRGVPVAALDFPPRLSADGLHDKIRHFERRVVRGLGHEVAINRDRISCFLDPEVTKCGFDEPVGTPRELKMTFTSVKRVHFGDIDNAVLWTPAIMEIGSSSPVNCVLTVSIAPMRAKGWRRKKSATISICSRVAVCAKELRAAAYRASLSPRGERHATDGG